MRWKIWERAPGQLPGISLGQAEASWASLRSSLPVAIEASGTLPADSAPLNALAAVQPGHGWQDSHIVLSGNHYQFFLIEAPAVPAEELREAIRWRIADMLTFPESEAEVDAFLLPDDAYRGRQRMAYVGVVHRPVLDELKHQADAARLPAASITIPEMALLALAQTVLPGEESAAVVFLGPQEGHLLLLQGKQLYLSRQAPIGWQQLANPMEYDSLLLEIQRSMDFYDSQIGKGAIRKVWLAPGPHAETLLSYLKENLAPAVELLPLSLPDGSELPVECAQAAGAVMRSLRESPSQDIEFLHRSRKLWWETWLGAQSVLLVSLLLLAVLVGVQTWTNHQLATLKKEADMARQEQTQATAALAAAEKELNETDAERHAREESEIRQQDLLRKNLEDIQQLQRGFSAPLEALARAHREGLWIDSIQLENGTPLRMILSGSVVKGSLLPDYLVRLGRQPELDSRALYQLRTEQATDQPPRFEISTYLREEKRP